MLQKREVVGIKKKKLKFGILYCSRTVAEKKMGHFEDEAEKMKWIQ